MFYRVLGTIIEANDMVDLLRKFGNRAELFNLLEAKMLVIVEITEAEAQFILNVGNNDGCLVDL